MFPAIMSLIGALRQKGQAENQALQNQADALRQTQVQVPTQQIPSINNVFGNY